MIVDYEYTPHIALIRDMRPPRKKRYKPRRWVVERTLAWLSTCRAMPEAYLPNSVGTTYVL